MSGRVQYATYVIDKKTVTLVMTTKYFISDQSYMERPTKNSFKCHAVADASIQIHLGNISR